MRQSKSTTRLAMQEIPQFEQKTFTVEYRNIGGNICRKYVDEDGIVLEERDRAAMCESCASCQECNYLRFGNICKKCQTYDCEISEFQEDDIDSHEK